MVRPVNLQKTVLTGIRGHVANLVEHPKFTNFIAALIILNAILLGLETDSAIKLDYGVYLRVIDLMILMVFVLEIALKIFAYRLSFFRDGWNIFDFVIISISLIPAGDTLTILRTLRIFRVLRLMSIVPSMRRVLTALFNAVPGMTSIMGIMLIIFYVSAVIATQTFGTSSDPEMQVFFGSIGASMYTLFQIMTLEGWPDIANPTIALFPWAWIYFIIFIISTSFAVLNLFVGIIVDAMDIIHDFEGENKGVKDMLHKEAGDIHSDIGDLRTQLNEIKSLLKDR